MAFRNAILFDLDGTLVDSAADFITVVNRMRCEDGLPPLPEQLIRNTVSDGSKALVSLAYALQEGTPGFEEKRTRLLDLYEEEMGNSARLFDGFPGFLATLEKQGVAWGIITNKPLRFTKPLLERLAIHPTRGVAICPDHVSRTKPDPEPLLLAATQLDIDPARCIYAGDHLRDVEAGIRAGMATIACGYGYIQEGDDFRHWGATASVTSVAELCRYVSAQFTLEWAA
jgi:2-phosphoglycolate phosphatase